MLLRLIILLLFLFINCSKPDLDSKGYDEDLYKKAVEIAQSIIITDGHIDVPYRLIEEMEDISEATAKGDFDYPRAKKGGLNAPFMSIYISARYQKSAGASKKHAEMQIAMMDSIIDANPNKFAKALTPDDVTRNFENGIISLPYGMENGSGIEDDIKNVQYFFEKGIRYITLTHGKKNLICDSSYDLENQDWNGLSPFGKKVVAEMNRLGIMIDISHVSDSTFYQALRLSKVPVICSHSSLRYFTPGWERNVNDDMLKELGKNGGVIQITFGSAFLTKLANLYSQARRDYHDQFMEENNITDDSDAELTAAMDKYKLEHPYPFATIEDVVDHIDHVVKVAGIDHVGLGSDFDGVGDSLPTGLKSVADFPNLVYHLLESGYSEGDIKKILSGNVLRVWQKVTDYAKSQG